MSYDTKLTNPKDAIGSTKLPTHLAPDTIKIYAALAFCEGALKYGTHNWRASGVRASIYRAALDRHIAKWWNGEDVDPKTGVPHLASAIACIGIIADAQLLGKLTDDRPPSSPELLKMIDDAAATVAGLKKLFENETPYHWTIADDAELRAREHTAEEIVALRATGDDKACLHADVCQLKAGHPGAHVDHGVVVQAIKIADVRAQNPPEADRGEPQEAPMFDRGEPGMARVGRVTIP